MISIFAGCANADALWYRIEQGSKVEIFDGAITYLAGEIEVGSCGKEDMQANPERDMYPMHSFRLENTPEELNLQQPGTSSINLFDGPGVGLTLGAGSLKVLPDGRVSSFSYYLSHLLAEEKGDTATVYFRKLKTDDVHISRFSFDTDDACPRRIELNLLIEDVWTLYRAVSQVSHTGQQVTVAQGVPGGKSRIIGKISIFATAISGSLHPAREPGRIRSMFRN
jgi:hypothetical protein